MTTATNLRDAPHARVYARWLPLPAWRALSLPARRLLVEILGGFAPVRTALSWPVRKSAEVLGTSKSTAARASRELEENGWIECATVAKFSE